jgi:MFS family permease
MSQDYAWPSSLRLELEAQRLNATARAAVGRETALAVVVARAPAFFDLFACALAASLVFPRAFFPGLTPAVAVFLGLLLALLPMAVAPVGGAIAAAVGRRHGRGVGLTGGQFALGASTTAMAFVPTHAQAGGFAIALLIACRLVQGVSLGAAWGPARRGGGLDLSALAAVAGLVLAGGLFAVLSRLLSAADFADWGWRYPFAIGFVLNIVGLFANLRALAIGAAEEAPGAALRRVK